MAKRKPMTTNGENSSAAPKKAQDSSASEQQGPQETIKAEFEAPEFQRELANFIKVVGDIRSKQLASSCQVLDNEEG